MTVMVGKHLNTVTDLMQGAFRKIDKCKTKGLSVHLEKTEVVVFTKKRKTNKVIRLEIKEANPDKEG